VTNNLFPGANSSGIRRAPAYISEPVFDRPERMSGEALRTDLQQIVSRSSRLPSRGDIQVSVVNGVVVLRGTVRNERERRLAEAVVRLTPGVRQVQNLLQPPK
jgi:osmotically-inducible protein OsmY